MNDSIFAEIDIEPINSRSAFPPVSAPAPAAIPVAPRAPDPIREKFYEMRSLATKRPFPKNDSELFYRQARFMEDFTDDFEGDAKFNMYFPFYQRMGYDYLRTYFTWRTRVRGGEIRETSVSYIFLYMYELLSGIGVSNPVDGLSKLMDVWKTFTNKDFAFSNQYAAIKNYMPGWLKDYHVFYELPHSFSEFVEEHGLQRHYSLTLLFDTQAEGQLALWNALSGYDVTKSKFYSGGNEELFSKCFDTVLGAIGRFCEEKGARFEDMLVYSVSKRSPWQPFKNALFGSRAVQTDREVHISKYERYFCKNGQWTANLPIYYSSQKDFIGYIIKKTEACLRNETGYKYKLVAEMRPGGKPFRELQRPAAKRAELDRVIEKAVADFHTEMTRIVVTVDHRRLSRIREEALETQEQLIVDGDNILKGAAYRHPALDPESCSGQAPGFPAVIRGIAGQARNDEACTHPIVIAPPADIPLTLSFSDGWKALKETLTDVEQEALKIALDGGDVKAFAADKGVMPEVLIDSINEKASDCIGDSIMELTDEVYLFSEYRNNISDMLI